jgi:hypothetical protein
MTPQESMQKGMENVKAYIDNRIQSIDTSGTATLFQDFFNMSVTVFGNNLPDNNNNNGGNDDIGQPEGAI